MKLALDDEAIYFICRFPRSLKRGSIEGGSVYHERDLFASSFLSVGASRRAWSRGAGRRGGPRGDLHRVRPGTTGYDRPHKRAIAPA